MSSAERRGDTLAVRPYALTGGRTRPPAGLTLEGLVTSTQRGLDRLPTLTIEYRRILRLATIPVSVAEVAAHTGAVMGVAKILVGDLLGDAMLTLRPGVQTTTPSVDILERVLHGLEAL